MSNQTLDILKEAMNLEDISSNGTRVAIIPMGADHPENYQVVEVRNSAINMSQFSDNECTEILAINILDSIEYENLNSNIVTIIEKMRKGCILKIGGTDSRMLSRTITAGMITVEQINQMLYSQRSITDVGLTKELLQSLGLEIVSTQLNGITYEIEARRS